MMTKNELLKTYKDKATGKTRRYTAFESDHGVYKVYIDLVLLDGYTSPLMFAVDVKDDYNGNERFDGWQIMTSDDVPSLFKRIREDRLAAENSSEESGEF